MKIITTTTKLNPLHPDFDMQLSGLATSIVNALGILPVSDKVNTAYEVPNEFLTLQTADLLHSKGVEIKDFPLFIEIDNIEDSNAFGVLGEDEEPLSWAEWKLDNHTFYEADGRIFIETNAGTGTYLDYSDLQTVRANLVLPADLPVIE